MRCCSTDTPDDDCTTTVETMFPVRHEAVAIDGTARAGVATTHRGSYETPCFMPVGTRGAIKYLSAADYEEVGARIVLGNTYHLMLRPGAETVARFGGLGKFAAFMPSTRRLCRTWNRR